MPRMLPSLNTPVEEDPLHNAQRRPANRPAHAHDPIRHALQVEAAEEAVLPLPRSVSKVRYAGQATTGMDLGVVRILCGQYGQYGTNTSNVGEAMPSDSTCRRPTNTCGETRCDLCKNSPPNIYIIADWHCRTKLRDAELVEPLLRKFLHCSCAPWMLTAI
jgi:hypothetical protein